MRVDRDVLLIADGMRGLSHELDCCVYLVGCGDRWVMIDSGVGLDSETILSNIRAEGIRTEEIKYLIVTHAHADHACGAKFFQDSLQVEVICPEIEAKLLQKGTDEELGLNMARPSIYPQDFKYVHASVDRVVTDGEEMKIGDKIFRFIQVPGHSPGIACVFIEQTKTLFSSDVVFHGGTIGLGNWPGCDLGEYRQNIRKLAGLGAEKLFPGHFLFTLRNGQSHVDQAIENLKLPWVPPSWQHRHPLR